MDASFSDVGLRNPDFNSTTGAGVAHDSLAGSRVYQVYNPPRVTDGHPDPQGFWSNNNATPLERPKELEAVPLDRRRTGEDEGEGA